MAVRLLIDNDVLLKAAHWGLLEYIPRIAGITWEEVAVLPQFPPRVKRADPKLFLDATIAVSLQTSLNCCSPLPDPDPVAISLLQGLQNLDAGEVLLIAVLAAHKDLLLMTGDKRALIALAELREKPAISDCCGRCLCMEQLLRHALTMLGCPALVKHIRRYPRIDKAALTIFGSVGERLQDDAEEGLRSYIDALRAEAPTVLSCSY